MIMDGNEIQESAAEHKIWVHNHKYCQDSEPCLVL